MSASYIVARYRTVACPAALVAELQRERRACDIEHASSIGEAESNALLAHAERIKADASNAVEQRA